MNYFNFLETKYVEAQERLKVKPQDVKVEDQAKFNAVMANIQLGRKTVETLYRLSLLVQYTLIILRIYKPPMYQSSIPTPPPKPELKVVQDESQKSA